MYSSLKFLLIGKLSTVSDRLIMVVHGAWSCFMVVRSCVGSLVMMAMSKAVWQVTSEVIGSSPADFGQQIRRQSCGGSIRRPRLGI